ncbi:MAG: aminotransferase class I/II-fold pyridoxal phosphate-dependent enzyme [Verrucomicrobiaceae bacterium]|nr:MAG: aminotransferase class I/II-fold pyridoxal phosphate-dependent enzyme [Verrucomicrobiaceae bacterium]
MISGIRPYFEFDEETLSSIATLLASGQVSNHGPQVHQFEERLAEYLGVKQTLAVSSGSDGLLLAVRALRLEPGKAILPAYTYIATLNAVVHAGLEPVFCDIEPGSFTMDPQVLSELLKQHNDVRCVLPVNVFGVPPDLTTIRQLCDQANTRLLYDNAHGFGTETNGHRFQDEPDVQVFSFHATKTLPAIEGGLIVSNDPDVFSLAKRLRNHGLAPNHSDTIPGFNAKLDEIRATVGLHSLRSFAETLSRRREYGARLTQCFRLFPDIFRVQHIPENVRSNFQNLGIICMPAEELGLSHVLDLFKTRGIGVRSYFDPPLYKFSSFDKGGPLPVTESIWSTLISFPIHSRMTEETLSRMEDAIRSIAGVLQTA